jgi:glycosyltransferase involved in cell wall biosynthesis
VKGTKFFVVKHLFSMPAFSVCIPSYNAATVIGATLRSLIEQTFTDWECLVVDDCSTDATEAIVSQFPDTRIRFIKNDKNLGYVGNLRRCRDLASGTYIYFLANDDVLSPFALERTYRAFQLAPDIALVTRPYYWFENDDPEVPIRHIEPVDRFNDRIVSVHDSDETLRSVLHSLGQVSSLAFKNSAFTEPISPYVFTAHIEPFLAMLKSYRAVYLHEYLLAVRVEHSQARTVPKIYNPSPLWTWVHMMQNVFAGSEWKRQRTTGIDHIASHVEGLVQIRTYSTFQAFLSEALLHIKYRPRNLLSLRFWAFAVGCLVTPPTVLRKLVDRYKPAINKDQLADVTPISAVKASS